MKAILRLCVVLEDKQPTQVVMIDDPGLKEDDMLLVRKALNSFSAKLDKIQGVDDPRCKDCKHWGKGKASINAWRESTVCFLKRKKILHPRFKDQVIYYAKSRMSKPCNNFDRKDD
jgi:hypothetical protein